MMITFNVFFNVVHICTLLSYCWRGGGYQRNGSWGCRRYGVSNVFGRNKVQIIDLKTLIREFTRLAGTFNLADYVPFLGPLDLQGPTQLLRTNSEAIDEFLEKIIDKHIQDVSKDEVNHMNFIDVVLSLMNKSNNYEDESLYAIDRKNVKAIILDALAGGTDTSITSIEWILSELLRHPRVMRQLQEELKNVVGMRRMVEESDLENLDYLNMVVKETLRLHPTTPLLIPHESMEDIVINGYYIPKKLRILINAWTIRRDPNVWSNNSLKEMAAAGNVVDISTRVAEVIEDMAYRMVFGHDKDEMIDLKTLIGEATSLAGTFNIADYLPFLGSFDLQGLTRRFQAASEAIDEVLEKIIDKHTKDARDGVNHMNFMDIMLSLMSKSNDFKDEPLYAIDRTNVKAIILDILVGGIDSSLISVDWALAELLRHPRVMKKVQEELKNVVGMGRTVEESDLKSLIYMNMVLKEALRLHPVGPFLIPRESVEHSTINEHYIPKKARILINTWAIGRDPNAWSNNAEEFFPERFIDNNIDLYGHDFELIPFGSGRRRCPGIQLVILGALWITLSQLKQLRASHQKLPPGPWGLPVIGCLHMLGNLPHRNLTRLAKKYGPIMYMRLGCVPTVIVSSAQATKLFLKTHDVVFASRPKLQAFEHLTYGTKGIAFSEYGPYWRNGLVQRFKAINKAADEVLEKIIDRRIQDGGKDHNHSNFIDIMLSLMSNFSNLRSESSYIIDRTNVKAILLDMLVGGIDSSSTTIEWVFSELLRHPRVMRQLQHELQNVVKMDRMVDESDLENLVYLNMVVKEVLRLHPIGPFLVPHASTEDITIEGHFIPKRSTILINTWAIGRDPNFWSDNVDEFLPERFINSNIDLQGRDFELIPFGSGRRGCPGIQLGLRTVRLVLAQLLHCFNWELPNDMSSDDLDMSEKFGLTMPRNGVSLNVNNNFLYVYLCMFFELCNSFSHTRSVDGLGLIPFFFQQMMSFCSCLRFES
uniref:Cytochrome P450 CYP736A12 n=1 Tax=Vitis vinifera TaxID=29760 RepID=F6GTJ6_VITVI